MHKPRQKSNRRGSVYLAVLGTAMIAGVLAFSALALQRVQNRMLSASSDVRQAQLNAEAAIEMGVLAIKNDPNWRTTYANGNWFTDRNMSDGKSTLSVIDPLDGNLADDPTEAIVMMGTGKAGVNDLAVQRVVKTVDAYTEPLECLRSSVAAGGDISLSGSTLRASNSGLITANATSASGSAVHGRVEAQSFNGSGYNGATTQITAAERPAMPNWSTVFGYFRATGTEIPLGSLPSRTPKLARNASLTSNDDQWDDDPPGLPDSDFSMVATHQGRTGCMKVERDEKRAGAGNRLAAGLMKPNTTYRITVDVHPNLLLPLQNYFKLFLITEYEDGTYVESIGSSTLLTFLNGWTQLTANATTPNWSTPPRAIYAVVNSDNPLGNNRTFYVDNLDVYQNGTRFISQATLGPNVNSLGTGADPSGLYWINCNGNRVVIERSRILGTLFLDNPGPGSCIDYGPIHMSPYKPGYPSLLVDGDFLIRATSRTLSEAENSSAADSLATNFNPANMPFTFGAASTSQINSDPTESYPSEIQGLIAISGGLTFQNDSLVRGSVIVGGNIANVTGSSGNLEVDYRPDSLYSPPPGFVGTAKHIGRPLSVRKAVMP